MNKIKGAWPHRTIPSDRDKMSFNDRKLFLRTECFPVWISIDDQTNISFKPVWAWSKHLSFSWKFVIVFCDYTHVSAATKQLYEWFSPPVRPYVLPSVFHIFFTIFPSSHHHGISVDITNDKSDGNAKVTVRGLRSRSQMSKPSLTVPGQ